MKIIMFMEFCPPRHATRQKWVCGPTNSSKDRGSSSAHPYDQNACFNLLHASRPVAALVADATQPAHACNLWRSVTLGNRCPAPRTGARIRANTKTAIKWETTNMKLRLGLGLLAICLVSAVTPAQAASHPCAADAVAQAKKLLRFHFGPDASTQQISDGDKAILKAPVRALSGKGQFDTLQITSFIYKASYRMRFMYARLPGNCVLMGQEILEASNPY
jgi:hypothetical protein